MKKVLSLVLVLTLVLGSFGLTFAAPSDVVGTEYEDAVERLGQLGVLTGYEDGTFKPENTITRAEFAAVVVRAKGLEAAAKASAAGTAFTDVTPGSWAAGYVNVASKMGFVNGMGDGSFAPNSPVTYEQAVTMVMRALGYGPAAEARGGYPFGYLIVANEAGLLEKVNGTTGSPAPRGLVAKIVDNALEIPLMVQVSYGDRVEHIVSGTREGVAEKTLLSELGFTKFTGRVIEANASKEFVKIEDSKGNIKTLNADEDFDFQNAYGLRLRVWYDTNGNIKLYTALDTPLFDAVKSDEHADIYLYGEDDYYELATDKDGKVIATIYLDGEKVKIADIDEFDADYAKIVLDSYGDIIWAEGFNFDGNITVEKLDGNVVESYGYEELSLKGYTIVDKDGKTISIEDLEENDIVFYNKDNKFAVVANMTVEGTIEKVYTDRFVVDGETYDIDGRYLDDKYMNDLTDAVLDSMRKEEKEATVYFDFYGNVVLVVGTRAASTTASNYYLLAAPSREWTDKRNNAVYYTLDVLNAEGKIVKYDVKKSEVNDAKNTVQFIVDGSKVDWNLDTVNTILRLTINTSDKVTKVEVLENHAISSDLKVTAGYAGGYKLQDSTVVFRADGEAVEDYDITTWAKAEDVFTKITAGRYYVGANGRVVAIFADTTDAKAATTIYNARIKDVATKRNEIKEVTFLAGGKEYKLETETKSITGIEKLAKYAMVKLTVVNKTEKIKSVEDLSYVNAKVTNLKPGNKAIVTDLGEFELDDNAVIYKDGTNTTLRFADLKVGDYLNIYKKAESNRFIIYAVKVAGPKDPVVTKGVVTYINTANTAFEVDGVIYNITGATVLKYNGATVALGLEAGNMINVGDKVKVEGNVITVTESATLAAKVAKDKAVAKAAARFAQTKVKFATAALTVANDTDLAIAKAEVAKITAPALTAAELLLIDETTTPKKSEYNAAEGFLATTITNIATYEGSAAVTELDTLIAALPANTDPAFAAKVAEAKAKYDALTGAQKDQLATGNEAKLLNAVDMVTAMEEVATAKAAFAGLTLVDADRATSTILKPAAHANGSTYAIAVSNIVGATDGTATGTDPITVTRDTAAQFTFDVTVTISSTVGTQTATDNTLVYTVTVPMTGNVTIAVK